MIKGTPTLNEFVTSQRDAILARAREKRVTPLFLAALAETLRVETATAYSSDAVDEAPAGGTGDPLASGLSVSQVIDGYVDICQVITALAIEQHVRITVEEFHALDRCLDKSIAGAVEGTKPT